jgi:hypothetical protein
MSSFKEIKKKENIKVYESKVKRLFASDLLSENDLKYLNLQFNLYTMRKTYINLFTCISAVVVYNFFIIRELHRYKKFVITSCVAYSIYRIFRNRNRLHYDIIIGPYLEKYRIR